MHIYISTLNFPYRYVCVFLYICLFVCLSLSLAPLLCTLYSLYTIFFLNFSLILITALKNKGGKKCNYKKKTGLQFVCHKISYVKQYF